MQQAAEFIAQAVLETNNIGVCLVDACAPDMPIVYINRGFESITGYTASEVVGKNCRFLQGAHHDQPSVPLIAEALREHRTISVVLKNFRKSGEEFFNHLHLFPLYNEAGELTHYVGIQNDVTALKRDEETLQQENTALKRTVQQRTAELQEFVSELQGELRIQKRLEAQLREMNSLLESKVEERTSELRVALEKQKTLNEIRARFIMTVSHEFRTPLSGVALATGILKKFTEQFSPAERQEQLDNIREAVEHLTELIDEVIFISKSEANKLDFSPHPMDIRRLCATIIIQAQRIDTQHHNFIVHCPESEVMIDGDEKLLRSAITNLVGNAVKYSPPHTTVEVEVLPSDTAVLIAVKDKGIGIPTEDIANLFEPFHRAANAQKIQGTGLGLSIVKNAIQRHGGTVDVRSIINTGTVFTITLPRNQNSNNSNQDESTEGNDV
jgi:PAS domain S-box-containing protein